MGVGERAEILEGTQIVLLDALAIRIHATEFPDRHDLAVAGRVFKRLQYSLGVAIQQRLSASSKGQERDLVPRPPQAEPRRGSRRCDANAQRGSNVGGAWGAIKPPVT